VFVCVCMHVCTHVWVSTSIVPVKEFFTHTMLRVSSHFIHFLSFCNNTHSCDTCGHSPEEAEERSDRAYSIPFTPPGLFQLPLPPVSLLPPLTATQPIFSPLTLDNNPGPFPKIDEKNQVFQPMEVFLSAPPCECDPLRLLTGAA